MILVPYIGYTLSNLLLWVRSSHSFTIWQFCVKERKQYTVRALARTRHAHHFDGKKINNFGPFYTISVHFWTFRPFLMITFSKVTGIFKILAKALYSVSKISNWHWCQCYLTVTGLACRYITIVHMRTCSVGWDLCTSFNRACSKVCVDAAANFKSYRL